MLVLHLASVLAGALLFRHAGGTSTSHAYFVNTPPHHCCNLPCLSSADLLVLQLLPRAPQPRSAEPHRPRQVTGPPAEAVPACLAQACLWQAAATWPACLALLAPPLHSSAPPLRLLCLSHLPLHPRPPPPLQVPAAPGGAVGLAAAQGRRGARGGPGGGGGGNLLLGLLDLHQRFRGAARGGGAGAGGVRSDPGLQHHDDVRRHLHRGGRLRTPATGKCRGAGPHAEHAVGWPARGAGAHHRMGGAAGVLLHTPECACTALCVAGARQHICGGLAAEAAAAAASGGSWLALLRGGWRPPCHCLVTQLVSLEILQGSKQTVGGKLLVPHPPSQWHAGRRDGAGAVQAAPTVLPQESLVCWGPQQTA